MVFIYLWRQQPFLHFIFFPCLRDVVFPKYSNNCHSSPQNYSSTDYSTIFYIFCHASILQVSEQIYFSRKFTGKTPKCLHSSGVFEDHFFHLGLYILTSSFSYRIKYVIDETFCNQLISIFNDFFAFFNLH